jgi:hypothetical protein
MEAKVEYPFSCQKIDKNRVSINQKRIPNFAEEDERMLTSKVVG